MKNPYSCLVLFSGILLLNVSLGIAQKPDFSPKVYTNSDNKIYWNKELPVYLRIATTPDDKGLLLKSEQQAEYVNPLYFDTEGINYIRTRYAVDQETGETIVPKIEVLMEVYADGKPPETIDVFNSVPGYTDDETRYIGRNLSVDLTSSDELSGVDQIFFSLNGQDFQPFQKEIAFDQEGAQVLTFFAVDQVGNVEDDTERKFSIDLSAPTTFHNINGIAEDYIISSNSTIYLTVEDNLSGVQHTYYRFDEEEFHLYDGKTLPVADLTDGDHVLQYYAVDNVENKEEVKEFKFYFDKTAPITVADVLGDRYIVEENVYLSGRAKMKLTAVDNKAGVKEIRYSIDDGDFQVYDQPFYLPSVSGNHIVRYYSVDNLSNQTVGRGGSGYEEFKHSVSKIYLDLTGPMVDFQYKGKHFETRDTVFINKSTQIQLNATDPESGLQYINYSIDGVSEETRYDGPFLLDRSGVHNIEVFGYDNVNNRNVKTFFCFVDGESPQILVNFSVKPIAEQNGLDVYPSYVRIYLAATDQLVGTDKIFYRINDTSEKTYSAALNNFRKNTKYSITIRGIDLLGNERIETIEFYTGN